MTRPDSRPLRVLASPASGQADGNPYITSLYKAVEQTGRAVVEDFDRSKLVAESFDVIHIHWPEYLVRWRAPLVTVLLDVVKVLIGLRIARWRGARLVWTGHDLQPHERHHRALHAIYTWSFDRQVDLVISLGDAATQQLVAVHKAVARVPVHVVQHGHYRDSYPPPLPKSEARAALGLPSDARVLLLLGQIRRYKNAAVLARAVATDHRDLHLVVAGRAAVDAGLATELEEISGGANNVTTHLDTVPVADVTAYHSAADVVVLPYRLGSTLHSGAALLALSMSRPVVVPDTPSMRELQHSVGSRWVRTYDGDVDEALIAARDALADLPERPLDLAALDWPGLGQATVDAYEAAFAKRRSSLTSRLRRVV